ncbi:hypothetical protein EC973_000761, partial [Apophysomyces ossiformis]
EPVKHFDSTKHIKLYWRRRNAEKDSSSNKRKTLPKTVNTCKIATRNKHTNTTK